MNVTVGSPWNTKSMFPAIPGSLVIVIVAIVILNHNRDILLQMSLLPKLQKWFKNKLEHKKQNVDYIYGYMVTTKIKSDQTEFDKSLHLWLIALVSTVSVIKAIQSSHRVFFVC